MSINLPFSLCLFLYPYDLHECIFCYFLYQIKQRYTYLYIYELYIIEKSDIEYVVMQNNKNKYMYISQQFSIITSAADIKCQ